MIGWNAIRGALDSRLAAMQPGALIAWPGVPFDPPASGTWFKPTVKPGRVEAALGENASTHPGGVYQVSIFTKMEAGSGDLYATADKVAAHFDRVTLQTATQPVQCGVPVAGPLLQDPEWIHFPISIPFFCL